MADILLFIKKGWKITWQEKTLWLFGALMLITPVLDMLWYQYGERFIPRSQISTFSLLKSSIGFFISWFTTVGLTIIAGRVVMGEPFTLRGVIRRMVRTLKRVIGFDFLCGLSILPFLCPALFYMFKYHQRTSTFPPTVFLFFIPLVFIGDMFYFPKVEIILNNTRIREGIRTAWPVFRKHFLTFVGLGICISCMVIVIRISIYTLAMLIQSNFDLTSLSKLNYFFPALSLYKNGFYYLADGVRGAFFGIFNTATLISAYFYYKGMDTGEGVESLPE